MRGSLLALVKSIYYKRARINIALFTDIVQNSNHKLHQLVTHSGHTQQLFQILRIHANVFNTGV